MNGKKGDDSLLRTLSGKLTKMSRRRVVGQVLLAIVVIASVALVGWLGWAWNQSRLPGSYNVMDFGTPDFGGGPSASAHHSSSRAGTSVADLTGPRAGRPDFRRTLIAQQSKVRLRSGQVVDAWTFNGTIPGPQLRPRRGDLVEVTLVNKDITDGVTIHWHGVDVPNAEDGVAGVTQDAVMPGKRYTYRFRVLQEGSFWYHSHQVGSEQVRRGLYGPLLIEPSDPERPSSRMLDVPVLVHLLAGRTTIGGADVLERRAVEPGRLVRLRLVNTDNFPRRFVVAGAPFRVTAIDGTDVNRPGPLEADVLELGAGGRFDVTFKMPRTPVKLQVADSTAGISFSASGREDIDVVVPRRIFDPSTYGQSKPTPFDASSQFDRSFVMTITRKPGFLNGRPGLQWAVNGQIYPRTPMFMVREGDLVKMQIVNRTGAYHPMHLHGHHMLVLSRNGRPVTGSPWWVDTLNVGPNESYDAAFRADNPGLWMDHCHNLRHAAKGLTMHVVYEGVTTPFRAGDDAGNHPE